MRLKEQSILTKLFLLLFIYLLFFSPFMVPSLFPCCLSCYLFFLFLFSPLIILNLCPSFSLVEEEQLAFLNTRCSVSLMQKLNWCWPLCDFKSCAYVCVCVCVCVCMGNCVFVTVFMYNSNWECVCISLCLCVSVSLLQLLRGNAPGRQRQ